MNPERAAVFIDNSNVYRRLKDLRKTEKHWICLYDPLVLALRLAGARNLVKTYFYCTPPPSHMLRTAAGSANHGLQTKYIAAVQKLPGVEVRFGNLQGVGSDLNEKNLDTQLTADMITLAAQNAYDTAILVSNDSDYISAITPVKETFKKKIELVYFRGGISTELWRIADVPRRARPSFFKNIGPL